MVIFPQGGRLGEGRCLVNGMSDKFRILLWHQTIPFRWNGRSASVFRAVSTSHLTKSTCQNSSPLLTSPTALQSCSSSAENLMSNFSRVSEKSGLIWPSKPTSNSWPWQGATIETCPTHRASSADAFHTFECMCAVCSQLPCLTDPIHSSRGLHGFAKLHAAFSRSWMGARIFCLFVSTMLPFISISSTMKCACQTPHTSIIWAL